MLLQFAAFGSLDTLLHGEQWELPPAPPVTEAHRRQALMNRARSDLRLRWQLAYDIADAMHYLHAKCSPAILHLDLKPLNVLVTADGRARVADFGHARVTGEAHGGYHGVGRRIKRCTAIMHEVVCVSVGGGYCLAIAIGVSFWQTLAQCVQIASWSVARLLWASFNCQI